jgi:hypothetical protein
MSEGKKVFPTHPAGYGGGESEQEDKMKTNFKLKTDYAKAIYALGVNVEGRNHATRITEKNSLKACKTKLASGCHLTEHEKRMYDALVMKGLEIYKTL